MIKTKRVIFLAPCSFRNTHEKTIKYFLLSSESNYMHLNKIQLLCIATAVLILVYSIKNNRENFTTQSAQQFINVQKRLNPNSIFDLEELANQVSQRELDEFNKDETWHWTAETERKYTEAVKRNPYIRAPVDEAVAHAKRLYNERAIQMVLNNEY